MFDQLICGAMLIDGTGRPARRADLGVVGARIQAIGELGHAEACERTSAGGLCVCPGFIDMHSHSDLSLMEDPLGQSKIRQGVTTELVGQCGFSPFPLPEAEPRIPPSTLQTTYSAEIDRIDWRDLAGYAGRIARHGSALNIAPLLGHAALRAAVVGYHNRPPTPEELHEMRRLATVALEQGAFGLSSGLTLAPSSYADAAELCALSELVAAYDGIYDTHVRFQVGQDLQCLEEAIELGRRTGVRVEIAHMGFTDPRVPGLPARQATLLERANAAGIDVAFDLYPYTASFTMLSQLLPAWAQEGGLPALLARLRDPVVRRRVAKDVEGGWLGGLPWEWDKLYVSSPGKKGDPAWAGRHVQDIAADWGVEPPEAYLRLIDISEDGVASVLFDQLEETKQFFMQHPLSLFGSDGSALAADGRLAGVKVHPRYYGAFPRVLGRYVRDLGILTLETAIHKMTGRPAARLGLCDRGRLAVGHFADLVVFDPQTVADRATFDAPQQYPVGIPHVMVNGQWVIRHGQHTGARPAGVLRHHAGAPLGGKRGVLS
jgi:N-acyl-D-aspartate/D-glutamate deacylase